MTPSVAPPNTEMSKHALRSDDVISRDLIDESMTLDSAIAGANNTITIAVVNI